MLICFCYQQLQTSGAKERSKTFHLAVAGIQQTSSRLQLERQQLVQKLLRTPPAQAVDDPIRTAAGTLYTVFCKYKLNRGEPSWAMDGQLEVTEATFWRMSTTSATQGRLGGPARYGHKSATSRLLHHVSLDAKFAVERRKRRKEWCGERFKVALNKVKNVSFAQRSAHCDSRIWRPELIEPAAERKQHARAHADDDRRSNRPSPTHRFCRSAIFRPITPCNVWFFWVSRHRSIILAKKMETFSGRFWEIPGSVLKLELLKMLIDPQNATVFFQAVSGKSSWSFSCRWTQYQWEKNSY